MGGRKVFNNSVTRLYEEEGVIKRDLLLAKALPVHKEERLPVLFTFAIADETYDELKKRVNNGEVLTLDELQSNYAAGQEDIDKLADWLKSEGFEVMGQSPDGMGLYASAHIAQLEKSLQTHFVRVTRNGKTYNAAETAPSLPEEVGEAVYAINGLQPFLQAHKKSTRVIPADGNRMAIAADQATNATTTATNNAYAPPYVVSEVLAAYNAASLGLTGAGQTVAILIDNVPNDSDLVAFWQANYVNTDISRITKINVNNYPTLPAPEGEETLDTEWVSGIAPYADVRVYATGTLGAIDIQNAYDRIIADTATVPGMRQLSISIGLGELYYGGPHGEVSTQSQKLLRLAALGVNVFVSSGDAGSNPDQGGHSPTGATQVEFAASSPYTIGVGGTTMVLGGDGSVQYEVGWTGSGGGVSAYFSRPAWQVANGIPLGATMRMVPDVSCVADPNTGALIIFNGQAAMIGGTSWSTPVWAGFCALINQARIKAGMPPMPFINPSLYSLAGTPCFRDIIVGTNGVYGAGVGYDMVTGLGVPDVAALVSALTA